MPKLDVYRQAYYDYSSKASEIARTLALSAFAIVWIFRAQPDDPSALIFPRALIEVASCAALALAFDLAHYIVGAAIWGYWVRRQEKRGSNDETILLAPRWLNWPTLGFFWAKLAIVVVSYSLLLIFLWDRLGEAGAHDLRLPPQ